MFCPQGRLSYPQAVPCQWLETQAQDGWATLIVPKGAGGGYLGTIRPPEASLYPDSPPLGYNKSCPAGYRSKALRGTDEPSRFLMGLKALMVVLGFQGL